MSYILEALKKAEQEREIGSVPGIGSEHGATPAGSGGGRWIWLLVVVLIINAGLLVLALWPDPDPPPVSTAAPDKSATQSLEPPVNRSAGSAPAPVAARVARQPAPVAPVAEQPLASPVPAGSMVQAPAPLKPLPAAPELPQKAVVESRMVATPDGLPALPEVSSRPQPQAPNSNLPLWPQVSAQLFQQMRGGLRLDVHVFSDQPHERFVLINMQKYNEGQRLQEGPVVDEITPEGVILSYQGQRFRVQSQ